MLVLLVRLHTASYFPYVLAFLDFLHSGLTEIATDSERIQDRVLPCSTLSVLFRRDEREGGRTRHENGGMVRRTEVGD